MTGGRKRSGASVGAERPSISSDRRHPMTREIFMVRHAPTSTPPGTVPAADPPLREGDYGLSRVTALLPEGADWLVSPTERTRRTAELLAPALAPFSTCEEPLLVEMDHGEWHGRPIEEVWSILAKEPLHNWQFFGADTVPPGGESFAQLCARMRRWMDSMTESFEGISGVDEACIRPAVAVTHAGVIRAAMTVALDAPPERLVGVPVPNFGVLKLKVMASADALHAGGPWLFDGLTDPRAVESR